MTEFNLSEHICNPQVIRTKHVKEFIKRLKEELFGDAIAPTDNESIEIIHKLAGKDLIADVNELNKSGGENDI